MELLSRVQRVMHNNVMTPRFTDVVFKRIGFAIQKGLATQLVARLPSTTISFPPSEFSHLRDNETLVGSPIPISPSSSVGSSSLVRSTTSPPDYLFDESIFAELDNSLWIISRPLGSEPDPEEPNTR
ncbi:hypothetical protein Tco_0242508 [Tanacetum coccineum]